MSDTKQLKILIPVELHKRLKLATSIQGVSMASIILKDLDERIKELEKKFTLIHNE